MAEKKSEKSLIETELSPDFSVFHCDGAFGGMSNDKDIAWIQFFQDIPDVEVLTAKGEMQVTKIRRQMLVDLRMSAATFKAIAELIDGSFKQTEMKK